MPIQRLPRATSLPSISQLLETLNPRPSAQQLARAFRVHERTVRRWIAADHAPVSVRLALFWITPYGTSELDAHLHARATIAAGHVDALRRDNAALRRELSRLLALGDFGAANDPLQLELPIRPVGRPRSASARP